MTHINSLQSSVYVAQTVLPAEVSCLSSESMMAYCETRLRDIDKGVEAQMADQIAIMKRKKAINTAVAKVGAFETPDAKARDKVFDVIEGAAKALPANDPTRKKLEGLRAHYDDTFVDGKGKELNKDKLRTEWQEFGADLKALSDELGSDSEMSMIRLQSTISQRQTIVSLITNIMAKMQEATDKIVGNIR